MKTNTKLILGILTGVLVIGFIIVWDLVIKENIESEEVVVIRPGAVVHRYEVIKKEDLLVEKRNRATLVQGFVSSADINSVTGKQAKQTLVGNQMISMRQIDLEDFEPNPLKGEAIRPIPNQWIYAIPATVRRKDKIDIYLIKQTVGDRNTNEERYSNEKYVGLSPEQENVLEDEENTNKIEDQAYDSQETSTKKNSAAASTTKLIGDEQEVLDFEANRKRWLEQKGLSQEQWEHLVSDTKLPVLVDVPVAYAKDGSGNEILTDETLIGTEKDNERLKATGTIVNLELLLSEDDHRLLLSYIQNGYQLYITYN